MIGWTGNFKTEISKCSWNFYLNLTACILFICRLIWPDSPYQQRYSFEILKCSFDDKIELFLSEIDFTNATCRWHKKKCKVIIRKVDADYSL